MFRISLRSWLILVTGAMVVSSVGGWALFKEVDDRTDAQLQQELHRTKELLESGKIYGGQLARDYLALAQPAIVEKYGSFTEYRHESKLDQLSILIVAKDGVLIKAEWDHCPVYDTYFDVPTSGEQY